MTQKELIIGLKEGRYDSYETLFRLYHHKFVRFANSILKDKIAAEDIVQETFMKVWLNRSGLDENQSIFNYLYILTKRAVLNFLRDRKYAESLSSDSISRITEQSGVESKLDREELKRIVREEIERMPGQRRTVFTMSRIDGLTNKEIADSLDLSVRTVERHISLALSDIRKNLS